MPGRRTHVAVGLAAGVAVGAVSASFLPEEQRLIEVAAAALGGMIGGAMPDVLEPATSPNHRGVCHSVVAGSAIATGLFIHVRADCQARARDCDARATLNPVGSEVRSNEELKACLWRALGAITLGVAAGYASHVLLDAQTSDGVPLIVRGL